MLISLPDATRVNRRIRRPSVTRLAYTGGSSDGRSQWSPFLWCTGGEGPLIWVTTVYVPVDPRSRFWVVSGDERGFLPTRSASRGLRFGANPPDLAGFDPKQVRTGGAIAQKRPSPRYAAQALSKPAQDEWCGTVSTEG